VNEWGWKTTYLDIDDADAYMRDREREELSIIARELLMKIEWAEAKVLLSTEPLSTETTARTLNGRRAIVLNGEIK